MLLQGENVITNMFESAKQALQTIQRWTFDLYSLFCK